MSSFESEVRELVVAGEGERTEFKAGIPHPVLIAKHLAAFANGSGGRLIFGIDDRLAGDSAIVGIDPDRVTDRVSQAIEHMSPQPTIVSRVGAVDGKTLVMVYVAPHNDKPVLADGGAYTRVGTMTAPAPASRLLHGVGPTTSESELRQRLKQLAEGIESLTKGFEYLTERDARQEELIVRQAEMIDRLHAGSGWKQKLLWATIGALIGLPLSLVSLMFS